MMTTTTFQSLRPTFLSLRWVSHYRLTFEIIRLSVYKSTMAKHHYWWSYVIDAHHQKCHYFTTVSNHQQICINLMDILTYNLMIRFSNEGPWRPPRSLSGRPTSELCFIFLPLAGRHSNTQTNKPLNCDDLASQNCLVGGTERQTVT